MNRALVYAMIVVAAGCGKTNEDAPAKPVEAPSKPAAPAPRRRRSPAS